MREVNNLLSTASRISDCTKFTNFLRDRRQGVVLNGKSSNWSTVPAGVPQGSVLGPLFFLVYINDLPENVSCSVKLFADDTSLFSVVKNEHDTGLDMNYDLEKIRMWAWQWKMLFNADKIEEVIFSWKRAKPHHPILKLGNEEVKTSSEHKHLGMILDHMGGFSTSSMSSGTLSKFHRFVSENEIKIIMKMRFVMKRIINDFESVALPGYFI